ncbi:VCBS domain-containing protein [Bradyrhizobium sp. 1(2017)]|uniref:VCBS domain-containing protein n=1 Tax=Bradyrhizobium sp. 1(2017) TaxID=1404888 RepID=UPI00140EB6FA|nr:VCBS domain-containing protein [Bradyrhizobium sp. 1(2017)]QIO32152.1 hypothetical protein HAP40_10035 [Bradyrhizobium sp. 1(2017)]
MLVAFGVGARDGVVTTSPLEIIGIVETAFGDVTLTRDSGAAIKVSIGDLVCRHDVIETAAYSQVGIRLLDDTLFNVFSQARIELRELASESDAASRSTAVAVTSGSFAFAAGRLASSGILTVDTPLGSIRGHAASKGFGILTIAALTFSMMEHARAADPDATFVDDDTITYKDMQHGAFELVTKEPVPRRIIVDDPGETVVLNRIGSSISVSQVTNSAARMEELQAAQRDVLANFTRESMGSSTPPFSNSPGLQHINFTSDITTTEPTNELPPLLPIEFPLIVLPQPTLRLPTAPIKIDTVTFDEFTASSGTFGASSPLNAALTYGLDGGTVGSTVLNGLTYDVSQTGPYGTLYLNSASGAYTFVPNNAAINALTSPTTASFVVTVSGGGLSASEAFNISIIGVNDTAAISGDTSGAVMEAGGGVNAAAGTSTITGTLTSTDVDHPPNTFTAVSSPTKSTGGYGHFTMTSAGVWTYTLDDGNSKVQALNVGDTLTDTLTVTSIDGTPQLVTITIQGSNDAAVISGTTTGSVVEASCASPGTPLATGTLVATDVDDPVSPFMAVICPTASLQGYGYFTITSAGAWTYTLDNNNCTVQALNICDTRTDQFTVTTVDGTQQVVTITINGVNDAAVISGTKTGSVLESGCISYGKPIATGTLAATDVDNPANTFTAVTSPAASAGGYGTFTMTAEGLWTYTLDNNNSVVDALDVCDTLTDHFTVTTIDGTAQIVTIAIRGASDADSYRSAADSGADRFDTITSMDNFRFVFEQTATSDSIHRGGVAVDGTPGSHGYAQADPHGRDDCFNFLNSAIESSGINFANDLFEPGNHHERAATAAEHGGAAAAADVSELNHDAAIAGGSAGHNALHDLLV